MNTVPPLLHVHELAGRSGGPWSQDDLDSACDAVRGECGWHVAPVLVADEVMVSGPAGQRLVLPTGVGGGRPWCTVTAIEDTRSGSPVTGWRVGTAGMLIRDRGWPRGEDNLVVTLTHGYERCPADLVAVVLERVRALAAPVPSGVRSESESRTDGAVARTRARTYADARLEPAWSLAAKAVLDRYRA